MISLLIMVVLIGHFFSYKIGQRIERIKWNKLIEKGILPKPKTKRR